MLETKWPLGIDLMLQAFSAAKDKRVLKFFCDMVDQSWRHVCLDRPRVKSLRNNKIQRMSKPSCQLMPRVSCLTMKLFKRDIWTNNAIDFGHEVRREVVTSLIGDGIFTQNGAPWKHSRALLRPQLFRKRYSDLNIFREHVDNMIESLPANGPVDLQPLFFRLTMDSATTLLFGKSVDSLKLDQAEDAERFTEAFQFAQEYTKKRYQFSRHCWLMNSRKYQSSCRTVHDFVDRMALRAIEDRRNGITSSGGTDTTNLLDSLVCETQDPVKPRGHLLHLLMGGRDTTATLLSWTM
jgi:cytochrome P450